MEDEGGHGAQRRIVEAMRRAVAARWNDAAVFVCPHGRVLVVVARDESGGLILETRHLMALQGGRPAGPMVEETGTEAEPADHVGWCTNGENFAEWLFLGLASEWNETLRLDPADLLACFDQMLEALPPA